MSAKRESARVMQSRAKAIAERAALAKDFRELLEKELRIDSTGVQGAFVTSAVSSYVEIVTLTAKFLRCSATKTDLARLASARTALVRALGMLGVGPKNGTEPDTAPNLENWLLDWRSRKKPGGVLALPEIEAPGEESDL